MEIKSTKNPELKIFSRYDLYRENIELKNFVVILDMFDLSQFLNEVFYDSKCGMVFFDYKPMPPSIKTMIKIHISYLSAFILTQYEDDYGLVAHGAITTD